MNSNKLCFLCFLLFALTTPLQSNAECSSEPSTEHTYRAEKKWPLHPEITIRVTVSFQEGSSFSSPADKMGLYDLFVETISTKDKKVISEFCDEGALASDAMELGGISIDTAPYILSKSTHAFGVRASHGNNSRSNIGRTNSITLFGVTGRKIRRLLKTMEMGGYFTEVSLREGEDCRATFSERRSTIALGEEHHRGLVDLVVTQLESEGESDREFSKSGNDCVEITTNKKLRKKVLVFNGVQYK